MTSRRPNTVDRLSQQTPGAAPAPAENSYGDDGGADVFINVPTVSKVNPEVEALRRQLAEATEKLQSQQGMSLEKALIPVADGKMVMHGFTFTTRSLELPKNMDKDSLLQGMNYISTFFRDVRAAMKFWLADLGIGYEDEHEIAPDALARYVKVQPKTFQGWMRVCRKIPPAMRIADLEFSHYLVLSKFIDKLKGREIEVLENCQKRGLSEREFRAYLESLTAGKKSKPRPAEKLFSKESRPVLGDMHKNYMKARKGDESAKGTLQQQIDQSRAWLDEIEKAAGLK